MKKTIFTIVIFSFVIASAQKKIKFGVKAGATISSLSYNHPISNNPDSKLGFLMGILTESKLTEKIAIQPELFFSKEGGKFNSSYNSNDSHFEIKQNIEILKISFPIMAKYYFIPNLAIEFGPELNYLVSATSSNELKVNSPTQNFIVNSETNMNENFSTYTNSEGGVKVYQDYGLEKINFALNFGASYDLKKGLFFNARYNLGLTTFAKNANGLAIKDPTDNLNYYADPSLEGAKLKVSNFQFGFGYKF